MLPSPPISRDCPSMNAGGCSLSLVTASCALPWVSLGKSAGSQGSFRGAPPTRRAPVPGPRAILAPSLGPAWGLDDALATGHGPSTSRGEGLPDPRVSRLQPGGHTPASGPHDRGTSQPTTRRRESRTRAGVAAAPVIGPAAPPAARAPPGWPAPRSGPSPRRSPDGETHTPDTREYRPRTPGTATGPSSAACPLADRDPVPRPTGRPRHSPQAGERSRPATKTAGPTPHALQRSAPTDR